MRTIMAVLLGFFAGVALVAAVQLISNRLYPLPAGVDPRDPAAMAAVVRDLPLGAFLLVLVSWFCGVTIGSWVASRVGRGIVPGIIVGLLQLIAGVATMMMIPHPIWFWGAGVLVFVIGTFIGTRLGAPGKLPAAAATGRTA